jgi:hypothetical protein
VTSRAGTWRAVHAGSNYYDRERGTQMEVQGHVMIVLVCSFISHGSVAGNSCLCKASRPAVGSTQLVTRDALPRRVALRH